MVSTKFEERYLNLLQQNMNKLALNLTIKCFETKDVYLDLGKCGLNDEDFEGGSDLDVALRKCSHLEHLVLSNSWHEWNEKTKRWNRQFSLNTLAENYFTTHPPALEELGNLSSLACCGDDNKTWAISDMAFVQSLPKIVRLNISDNQITELKGLDSLSVLQTFNISRNRINELKGLDSLTCLQTLYISNNQIAELKGLDALIALQDFAISSNQITELKGLGALTALQKFHIFNNQIKKLKGLDALTGLQAFYIFNNQITDLEGLDSLATLQTFHIAKNHITKLKGLDALKALKTFDISFNQIVDLEGLDALRSLQSFHISHNQITDLKGLDALSSLELFNISDNKIIDLKGLDALSSLQSFDISGNKIADITPLLKTYLLRKESPLKIILDDGGNVRPGEINVEDNPIRIPPMEIVYQGNDGIIYWCAAQDQGKTVNHETKVILFGNGRGGKTTLSLGLRKNKFVPLTEADKTHGILIETWNIPGKNLPEKLKEKIAENIRENDMRSPLAIKRPESFQIHLWDFGGQEYYHATHRLFMSNNILYLLVWETATNKQHDNEEEKRFDYPVSYWQKNINHFAPQNITLCIQNKVKRHGGTTDDLHFNIEWTDKNDERSIKRFEEDVENLQEIILEHLADLSYIGDLAPQVYDEIRQALQKVESPFISYEDYKKLCEAMDTTPGRIMRDDAQKETLIRFLDDTGALVCLRFRKGINSVALREYVFTDPVWLTQIIYKILEKEKAEFDGQHVEEIVSGDGLDALVWIGIMKQFELIFEIEKNNEKKYVVPQFLPDTHGNQTAYDMALNGKNMEHAFTLNYPGFLPRSNFLRLLAKYGRQNISFLYWKKGMLFFLIAKPYWLSAS